VPKKQKKDCRLLGSPFSDPQHIYNIIFLVKSQYKYTNCNKVLRFAQKRIVYFLHIAY